MTNYAGREARKLAHTPLIFQLVSYATRIVVVKTNTKI